MMSDDDTYQRLRTEAAKMLRLDATSLSGLEGLQCDLVSVLLLEVDNLSATSIAGQSIDTNRLADCVRILKTLLPAPLTPAQPPPDFAGAKERLSGLLRMRADNIAKREKRESEFLQEEITSLEATIARLRDDLAPARSAALEAAPVASVVPLRRAAPAKPSQPTAHEAWVQSHYGAGGGDFSPPGGWTTGPPPGSRR
jgi:hypothetical protein